jgi:hypothetical protein
MQDSSESDGEPGNAFLRQLTDMRVLGKKGRMPEQVGARASDAFAPFPANNVAYPDVPTGDTQRASADEAPPQEQRVLHDPASLLRPLGVDFLIFGAGDRPVLPPVMRGAGAHGHATGVGDAEGELGEAPGRAEGTGAARLTLDPPAIFSLVANTDATASDATGRRPALQQLPGAQGLVTSVGVLGGVPGAARERAEGPGASGATGGGHAVFPPFFPNTTPPTHTADAHRGPSEPRGGVGGMPGAARGRADGAGAAAALTLLDHRARSFVAAPRTTAPLIGGTADRALARRGYATQMAASALPLGDTDGGPPPLIDVGPAGCAQAQRTNRGFGGAVANTMGVGGVGLGCLAGDGAVAWGRGLDDVFSLPPLPASTGAIACVTPGHGVEGRSPPPPDLHVPHPCRLRAAWGPDSSLPSCAWGSNFRFRTRCALTA